MSVRNAPRGQPPLGPCLIRVRSQCKCNVGVQFDFIDCVRIALALCCHRVSVVICALAYVRFRFVPVGIYSKLENRGGEEI
eukprot:5958602-Lingulodinium_polyedra.AAC.1